MQIYDFEKGSSKTIDITPLETKQCYRCGQDSMLTSPELEFRVKFWFFNRSVKVFLVYCPKCGLCQAKVEVS